MKMMIISSDGFIPILAVEAIAREEQRLSVIQSLPEKMIQKIAMALPRRMMMPFKLITTARARNNEKCGSCGCSIPPGRVGRNCKACRDL